MRALRVVVLDLDLDDGLEPAAPVAGRGGADAR